MIVDTSAIVAVLRDEPERQAFVEAMLAADEVFMAAPTLVELTMVVDGLRDPVLSRALDTLLEQLGVRIVDFDERHARLARQAFNDFGRGSGSAARLDMGDCMSYAAAKATGHDLLFKGDDFVHTDVRPALGSGGR